MDPSQNNPTFQEVLKKACLSLNACIPQNMTETYDYLAKEMEDLAGEVTDNLCKRNGWYFSPLRKTEIKAYHKFKSPIYGLSFSSDGNVLASGSEDGDICLWDIEQSVCRQCIKHPDFVKKVAFTSKGLLSVLYEHTPVEHLISILNLETGKQYKGIKFRGSLQFAAIDYNEPIAFTSDGSGMVRSFGNKVVCSILDEQTLDALRDVYKLHDHHVTGKDDWHEQKKFPQDMFLAPFGSSYRAASTWYIANPSGSETLAQEESVVTALAFSADNKFLFCGLADKTVKIYDVKTHKEVHTILLPAVARSIIASPGGLSVACGLDDGTVHLYSCKEDLRHLVFKAALYNTIRANNSNSLESLSSHSLLNSCDEIFKKRVQHMICEKLQS